MTTKLLLYNGALTKLGERRLSSLSENREPRRALDGAYDDAFVNKVLIAGLWNFATRTVQADYSASVEPDFGYLRAFDKPDDFIRTIEVCTDERFTNPLLDYADEGNFWFSDLDTIYIKYVSNDTSYGGDLSLWPDNFSEYAQWALAEKVCKRLTQSEAGLQDARKELKKAMITAKSTDAMADPTKFLPSGSWVRSRTSSGGKFHKNNPWG